jgi:hypothetical protein
MQRNIKITKPLYLAEHLQRGVAEVVYARIKTHILANVVTAL